MFLPFVFSFFYGLCLVGVIVFVVIIVVFVFVRISVVVGGGNFGGDLK